MIFYYKYFFIGGSFICSLREERKMLMNKRAGFVIHVGGPLILLLLLVLFVLIAQARPEVAAEITQNVAELSQAVQGAVP